MMSRCPKMSVQILGLVVIPLAMPIAFPTTALAAKRTQAAAAKEVYAATDASEMQPGTANFAMPVDSEPGAALAVPAVAKTPAPQKAPKPSKASKTPAAQAQATATAAKRAVAATPTAAAPATPSTPANPAQSARLAAASYDTVPASQSDAILQRLKIVETLIRKYSRAYDYRTHTLKELEHIQSRLETAAAPASPARAAAPAAQQVPAVAVPTAPAVAAPDTSDAPQAESDTNQAGQAAAVEENAEDVNIGALPPPAEFTPDHADQEN